MKAWAVEDEEQCGLYFYVAETSWAARMQHCDVIGIDFREDWFPVRRCPSMDGLDPDNPLHAHYAGAIGFSHCPVCDASVQVMPEAGVDGDATHDPVPGGALYSDNGDGEIIAYVVDNTLYCSAACAARRP